MDDRELLELAAKAAGLLELGEWFDNYDIDSPVSQSFVVGNTEWNPLDDDGDALRLAVKLKFVVEIHDTFSDVRWDDGGKRENHVHDPYAATRRAIVRAAAEIGKRMK